MIDGKVNQIVIGLIDLIIGKMFLWDVNDVDKVGGINFVLSVGSSSSESCFEQFSNMVCGLFVIVGGSINISV